MEVISMDKVIEEFEALSTNAERIQRETLKRILEDNASAEYLQNLGLNGNPITSMSLSSGTTQGKPKHVPWNDEMFETYMQTHHTSLAYSSREFPIKNGKDLNFIYGSKQFKTKGGIIAANATTNVFRNPILQKCNNGTSNPMLQSKRSDIQRTFEQVWEELCNDIKEGVLSSKVTDPELINWYRLIPELFPNVKYIFGIMSGSMESYLEKLRHYAGELPLLTSVYGASEGIIAANINPKIPSELATYPVFPQNGYFEFIPLTQLENVNIVDPQPVGLTEVNVGEEYEIVITNLAGLYRYRVGDVVKVMGFHNSTPKLKFIRRSGVLLNVNIDKTTEKDLQSAVEATTKLLTEEKLVVVEFTSHVDLSKEPGHYVIFWEISGEASEQVLRECCNCLDKSFNDLSYVDSRIDKTIGALELRVVRKGTFQKILHHYLRLGASISQYKTPRCVGSAHNNVLHILSENVVKNYLSIAFNSILFGVKPV